MISPSHPESTVDDIVANTIVTESATSLTIGPSHPASTVDDIIANTIVTESATSLAISPSHSASTVDDIVANTIVTNATSLQKSSVWSTFFSTFITIFLAEMGDKTQLATLLLSAESQSPWIVFIGAGAALIATSLVGVLLGRYLAKVLSPRTLDIAAGMLLMVISILLLGDVVQL